MFDMCVRLVPPRVVAVHALQESYLVLCEHSVNFLKWERQERSFTVEPRYNDPRYNVILGITINMLCPDKSYSKMYGTEPRYNDLRYNDIPDITMSF